MDRPTWLGHDFDNDELRCSCGRDLISHNAQPRACPDFEPPVYHRRPIAGKTELDSLRRLLGLSHRTVAKQCGVSEETARRAVVAEVGGKHRTSPDTSERVVQFIQDMADKS